MDYTETTRGVGGMGGRSQEDAHKVDDGSPRVAGDAIQLVLGAFKVLQLGGCAGLPVQHDGVGPRGPVVENKGLGHAHHPEAGHERR